MNRMVKLVDLPDDHHRMDGERAKQNCPTAGPRRVATHSPESNIIPKYSAKLLKIDSSGCEQLIIMES
jgi:hypothetical protein